jgi:hypothetical protein
MLVFVVLAVVYALGSILKAKSSKAEQEKDEELTPKGPRKPPGGLRRLQEEFLREVRGPAGPAPRTEYEPERQAVPRKVRRPEPTVEKPWEMREFADLSVQGPQLESGIEELPEYTSKTVKKLKAERLGFAAKAPKVEDVSEPVLDYADRDELTRAILHYEILGRPLSMRDASERIIGL